MSGRYALNALVRLSNTFRSVAGAVADPTTVSLTVTAPGGTVTTYTYAAAEITKDSTGVYHKDLTANETGVWLYTWAGAGAVVATDAERFIVGDAPAQYATADAFRAYPHGAKHPDADLDELLQQASAVVDEVCDWGPNAFAASPTATARTFHGNGRAVLPIPPAVSISSVSIDGAAVDSAYWYGVQSRPERPYQGVGLTAGLTFTRDVRNVVVTAVWGFSLYPPVGIEHATIMQAAELIKERGAQAVALPGRTGEAAVNAGRTRVAQHLDRILMPFRRVV